MAKILKKIKEITNKKLADKRLEKQRQKKIEEQNRNAEENRKKLAEFSRRAEEIQRVVKKVYENSSGLREISRTLRDPKITQRSCKNAFDVVSEGIRQKYGLRFEFAEPGVVQALTNQPGNYATYNLRTKTFVMEKIPHPEDPRQINWYHMLKELRHEYGYFLLLKEYGSRDNIPWVGNLAATHLLDQMHD
jgi:type I site-specific restriction endonuclease